MEGYGWELRRHGIATTTINPGFVVSEMTAHNQFRMPFLVPTDIAADKIARAIQRRRRSYTFPWPMACLASRSAKSARSPGLYCGPPTILKLRVKRTATI